MQIATVITDPKQIEGLAVFSAIQAMQLHVRTGGRMMLTRTATPANIARRFKLIDPSTKKAPRTAQKCLELLQELRTQMMA